MEEATVLVGGWEAAGKMKDGADLSRVAGSEGKFGKPAFSPELLSFCETGF